MAHFHSDLVCNDGYDHGLTMEKLVSLFSILLIGSLASMVIFCLETLSKRSLPRASTQPHNESFDLQETLTSVANKWGISDRLEFLRDVQAAINRPH